MDSIKKLAELFTKFPTVGKRTAGRFVYYLIKQPKEETDEFINVIQELKNRIKLCQFCFNPFETNENQVSANLCPICSDTRRDKNLLCIVEKEMDLEDTEKINGLRLEELKQRVENKFSEIIVALNPTQEGKATSVLIERALKEINYSGKITHLAKGIPAGGELEYADEETLESALSGRK